MTSREMIKSRMLNAGLHHHPTQFFPQSIKILYIEFPLENISSPFHMHSRNFIEIQRMLQLSYLSINTRLYSLVNLLMNIQLNVQMNNIDRRAVDEHN